MVPMVAMVPMALTGPMIIKVMTPQAGATSQINERFKDQLSDRFLANPLGRVLYARRAVPA